MNFIPQYKSIQFQKSRNFVPEQIVGVTRNSAFIQNARLFLESNVWRRRVEKNTPHTPINCVPL